MWQRLLAIVALSCSAACYSQRDVVANCQGGECVPAVSPATSDAAAQPLDQPPDTTVNSPPGVVISEPIDPAATLFDPARIRTYELELAPADLARIDQRPSAEQYVQGTLTFDGTRYGPLGIRYKGSVGAFLAPCTAASSLGSRPGAKVGKCSMKVAFDEVDPEGRLLGLRKLNFHALGRDPSLLRERLGYDLFREMGVAAPRTAYARLIINGQLEGLFLIVEEIDGRFTRSRFSEGGEGNLYKEVWPLSEEPMLYRSALQSNRAPDTNVDKIIAFKRDIDMDPDAAASAWLDRDYMLRYLAVDRVILNDDGVMHWYCQGLLGTNRRGGNHNFYWYEEQRARRMWLIPWDLDGSLAPQSRVHIVSEWSAPANCSCVGTPGGVPQRAASCDPLTAALAKWRADYDATVDRFLAGPFSVEALAARIASWTTQITPVVVEAAGVRGAPDLETWRAATEELMQTLATVREHRGYPY